MTILRVTFERVEGNIAILLVRDEEELKIELPLGYLPEGVREGDILNLYLSKDEDATEEAKERIHDLIEKLKKKGQNL